MAGSTHEALSRAVRRILRPLVRILLRNGIAYGDFAEEVRRIYVEVAMNEFHVPGRKPSVSRTATITGLTRKEVHRLLEAAGNDDDGALAPQNRAAQVVAGWVRDTDFQDGRGEPRPLSLEDAGGGFPALVRRYSGDMTARAVLDELERVGAVQRLDDGRATLVERSYVPARDDTAKIELLGTDVALLMNTIHHNLDHSGRQARYQRKVLYDNLPEEYVERFRTQAAERCQELLEALDRELAANDRDINPAVTGTGSRRAGVGLFYFEGDRGDD
ncbi:MAG TPA: DUF6502 family protein [Gammaproteobacteria bacterium]|nr:DUF6502 family protein [Gammaproteobacteria bacterium]